MCEQFVARAAEPFRIDELWPFTERLERYGLAGFGWGAAWVTRRRSAVQPPRRARVPRRHRRCRQRSVREETTAVLVHLRRPSRLSTLQLADAQPFDDPAGRFAFSHNGDLREWRAARPTVPGRRAGSTVAPTPRSARAGSRTRGGSRLTRRIDSRALHARVRRPGQPRRPHGRRDGGPLRRQHREPHLHVPSRADRHRQHRHLLARPVGVQVRRDGRDRASAGARRRRRHARP